jgi:ankyrin repeat protein
LHVAAKRGRKNVVAAILDAGADVSATSDMHQTPLDLALKYGHSDVAELLQKKGGRSGAELSLHPAAAAGDLSAVRRHVRAGADIKQLTNHELPICIALQFRHWDVAKFLLKKKCDVTKRQKCDQTPLHVAAANGAPLHLLATLLKLGAHIDALDNYYWTPLCHAAEAGHEEIVDWLLDHSADVTRGHDAPFGFIGGHPFVTRPHCIRRTKSEYFFHRDESLPFPAFGVAAKRKRP